MYILLLFVSEENTLMRLHPETKKQPVSCYPCILGVLCLFKGHPPQINYQTQADRIKHFSIQVCFVWNKPKQNKSFSMEGKNLWVFMKCSISSQRFERTASTSNNFNNAPVSKVKIYLKPTFQAILRANVFWCTNHHIRDFFYILYEQIEKTQVQKGSQEYQASWVFRQDNSI